MEPLLGAARILCTRLLREEWGFDGVVVTDWGDMDIVVDGAEAVAAGNDIIMPGGPPVIQQILKGEGREPSYPPEIRNRRGDICSPC